MLCSSLGYSPAAPEHGKAYLGGRRRRVLIPRPPMERALVNHDAPHNPEKNRGFGCSSGKNAHKVPFPQASLETF